MLYSHMQVIKFTIISKADDNTLISMLTKPDGLLVRYLDLIILKVVRRQHITTLQMPIKESIGMCNTRWY